MVSSVGPTLGSIPQPEVTNSGRDSVLKRNFDECLSKGKLGEARRIACNDFSGSERESMLGQVCKAELNEREFVEAFRTGSYMASKDSFKEILTDFVRNNSDEDTFLDLNDVGCSKLDYEFVLEVFDLLLSVYTSLGLNSHADRLKEDIERYKCKGKVCGVIQGLILGRLSYLAGFTGPSSVAFMTSSAALLIAKPNLHRLDNLFGAIASVAAVGLGMSPAAAISAGVYTAFMGRLPLIQEVGKFTAYACLDVATGLLAAGTRIANGAAAMVCGIDQAMDRTMNKLAN